MSSSILLKFMHTVFVIRFYAIKSFICEDYSYCLLFAVCKCVLVCVCVQCACSNKIRDTRRIEFRCIEQQYSSKIYNGQYGNFRTIYAHQILCFDVL